MFVFLIFKYMFIAYHQQKSYVLKSYFRWACPKKKKQRVRLARLRPRHDTCLMWTCVMDRIGRTSKQLGTT